MLQLAQWVDRDAVNGLAAQVHAQHVSWRPDLYEMVPELYSEERFAEAIQQRQLYVAKIDRTVVGYTHFRMRSAESPGCISRKILLLEELCVEELCRNQGIGRQMMEDIHALAKAFGCTDLQLQVYPQNDAAVSFYQKYGFTIRSIEMQRSV